MSRTALEPKHFRSARDAFREGKTTPRAFLEHCIERIEALEPTVKAFKHLDLESARLAADEATARYAAGRALSPLDGCPVGIKDIIETKDMPTGCGSPAFEGARTGRDAACVQALRQAGAVIVGKTVTTEFAIGFSGETTNPHDPKRTPGGSSSGSAAAVGAGMLPLSLGTQTNGSVLRPASYNGVYGYKGTFGLLPIAGVHPVSISHDHLGVFANNLDDVWAAVSVMSELAGNPGYPGVQGISGRAPDEVKPRRLVRLFLKGWDEVEPGSQEAFDGAVDRLRGAGVEVIDRNTDPRVAELERQLDRDVGDSADIVAYDMRWPFTGYIEAHGDLIGKRIHEKVARAAELTNRDYAELLERRQAGRDAMARLLDDLGADGCIMPAASDPAPVGFEYTGSRTYLVYASWLGFPALSMPALEAEGLPWGMQVMGRPEQDASLCALSAGIGRILGMPSSG